MLCGMDLQEPTLNCMHATEIVWLSTTIMTVHLGRKLKKRDNIRAHLTTPRMEISTVDGANFAKSESH
jgi:hypothetical protein